jgi:proline iminopeptidase
MHGGLGWDHTYLRPGLDALGDTAQVIYYDHRGNGHSAMPDDWEAVTHATWAADADALRARLGHEQIVLFGHSYGGFLALEYALRYPGRLRGLILCDTTPALDYPDTMLSLARARSTPALFDTLVEALSGPVASDEALAEAIRTVLPIYFHRPEHVDLDAIVDAMTFRAAAFNRAFFHCVPRYDVTDRLPEIAVPSLILTGRHDWTCPPAQGERLLMGLPNAELRLFEKSGHMPFLEEPDLFTTVVKDWLRRTM